MSHAAGVSELEFELDGSCPLCKLSAATTSGAALEYIAPRPDGDVLAHITAEDVTPDSIKDASRRIDAISDLTILEAGANRVHFEIVTGGGLAKALGDHRAQIVV